MISSAETRKKPFLFFIVIFILSEVMTDNYILGTFNKEPPFLEFFLFVGLLLFQIFASPIQAGLSDIYGRRKSILVSLSFSLVSLILIFFYSSNILPYFSVLILINLSKGILGNTIPIAWSAVGDTVGEIGRKDIRFSFALSEASYAIGYLLLILINQLLSVNHSVIALISFIFVIIYLCAKYFTDTKDRECNINKKNNTSIFRYAINEFLLVAKDLKSKKIRLILLSFSFLEISLYSILILYADFHNHEASIIEAFMMIGYLVGTFLIKFCGDINNQKMMKLGWSISVLSIIPYFILFHFVENIGFVLAGCYFFHAIGNALLCPTILLIASEEKEPHERGKLYGLVESSDTLAFLVSSIIIMISERFHLNLFYLISFSFATIVISWWPYIQYEKLKKTADSA